MNRPLVHHEDQRCRGFNISAAERHRTTLDASRSTSHFARLGLTWQIRLVTLFDCAAERKQALARFRLCVCDSGAHMMMCVHGQTVTRRARICS